MKNTELIGNIKTLIKGLYQIVDKSSSGLTIKSMHDCAQVISKMYGFNSWNEFKQNIDYISKEYIESLPALGPDPEFKEVKIKKNKFTIISNVSKSESVTTELKEKILIQDILIGKSYKHKMKTPLFITIEPENMVVISSTDNSSILETIRKQIKTFGHSYISLTNSSNIKLDPWSYIFEQNGIELLFKMKENPNDFIMSWISTIRYLNHEMNFHPDIRECIDSLYLKGVVEIYDWLKNNKPNAAWYLQRYLDSLGIIENPDEYIISVDIQKQHWKSIAKEVKILEVMSSMYLNNTFQNNKTDILWNALTEKKNIKIGSLEKNQSFYKEFVTLELNRVSEEYQKLIKNKFTDSYKVWLLCPDFEAWETSNLLLLNNKDFLVKSYISQGKSLNLNTFFQRYDQIILGKLINVELPLQLKEKMLNLTEIWEENIWFDEKKSLRSLKNNEVFIWHGIKDLNKIKELRSFICEKINVQINLQ